MGRTIEFRGKSKKTGKFIYGYFLRKWDDTGESYEDRIKSYICNYDTGGNLEEEIQDNTEGEFIGRYDIFNKNLYEGDIIRYDLLEGLGEPYVSGLTTIVSINNIGLYHTNIKCIGNIYENPELL